MENPRRGAGRARGGGGLRRPHFPRPAVDDPPASRGARQPRAGIGLADRSRRRRSDCPRSGPPSGRASATTVASVVSVYEQLLRGPVESGQYTSFDYTQELTDHGVLASVGSVGDAYDNAMAESFVDSFKTELVADRVWQTRSQLELAVVEYIAWFNNDRLHESLGDIPPAEFEQLYAAQQDRLISLPMKEGTT
ncbi:MAG: transposase [Solirubrobacterales bacterium]|nr:transposase [Solirubrobacterales bacterium]